MARPAPPPYEPPIGIVPTVAINHGAIPVAVASDQPSTRPQLKPSEQRITWAPVGTETNVPFSGSSYRNVRAALINTFGPFPIVLRNPEHLLVLQAMAAAAGEGGLAYTTLHRALANLAGIELKDL